MGAILVAGDEGVLIANRLPAGARGIPVIDQADVPAAASCSLLAVEVRPPGHPLTMVGDPVALGAALGLGEPRGGRCRTGLARPARPLQRGRRPHRDGTAAGDGPAGDAAGSDRAVMARAAGRLAGGQLITLRAAARQAASWAPGTARALRAADATTPLDDLFAVDLAEVAAAATARRGSVGRAIAGGGFERGSHPRIVGRTVSCLLCFPSR